MKDELPTHSEFQQVYNPRARTIALAVLGTICIFWGATFPLMKNGMDAAEKHFPGANAFVAPVVFVALRFGLSSLLAPLLLVGLRDLRKKLTRRAMRNSFILSVLFIAAFAMQVAGLRMVSPSISAFTTGLFVVFVPIVMWTVTRRPPRARVWIAVALALAGVAVMGWNPDAGNEDDSLFAGILLTTGCAAGFAVHIVLTNYTTVREDPTVISLLSIFFMTGLCLAAVPVCADMGVVMAALPAMFADMKVFIPLIIMAAFSTVLAIYAWNRWQRELSPGRAAVLYTMEPVFAAIISIALEAESLRATLVVGGVLVIAANIWCEKADKPAPVSAP